MSTAHTPGPWNLIESRSLNHVEQDGTGKAIVSLPKTMLWNARLITAAPELLEALQAVVRVADRATDEFDLARAAIRKATGEAP